MLGIGFGEIILIAGIALIVIGPEKFPDFAKIVLRTVNDLRGYVDEIQKEVSKEIKPIKRELDQISKYDPEKYINALSKDITEKVEKPATTSDSAPIETEPSSTDTQNEDTVDSDGDPLDSDQQTENEEIASANTLDDTIDPTDEVESKSSTEVSEENADQDIDFSDPPIERLD